MRDHTIDVFFALLQGGLWEDIKVKGERLKGNDLSIDLFSSVDWQEVMRIAEEQSVEGLVTAGLEHIKDDKIPQDDLLEFIGQTLQIEQQNAEMNQFVGELVEKMRKADIYTLLVKGQGIAQCYERPLWRTCGDVDLYLSEDSFLKAKAFFRPLVESFDPDNDYTRHINMHYDPWIVEIHGDQHTNLSSWIDKELDNIHNDLFYSGNVRSCVLDKTQVFLPSADSDVIIVFTHFIKHFYKGGLGIRQVCDWCRLLWTFREKINVTLLENRLRKMGLMSEWKAFGALAVDYLGMPSEAMPFYENKRKWQRKAEKIKSFILEVGNFGHNRDMSYYGKYPYFIRKIISFGQRVGDVCRHALIFPLDSARFFPSMVVNGVRFAIRGE